MQKMSSWGLFRVAHLSLAAFGVERLGGPPAYLATGRLDGRSPGLSDYESSKGVHDTLPWPSSVRKV
jgi:hypothetical protein